jgi:hypothetical protein
MFDTDKSTPSTSTTLEYEQYFSYNVKKTIPFDMSYSEDFEVQKYFANMKNSHAPPCAFFFKRGGFKRRKS